MIDFSVNSIPKAPGIYAMYDQTNQKKVVYVGTSNNLRERIRDHIIRRNSSVTTGEFAILLDPKKISHVRWWQHDKFSDENHRMAAEHIAFEVLNPVLRSRGNVQTSVEKILGDQAFCQEMKRLFDNEPSNAYYPKNLDNLANLVFELDKRVSELEKQLKT